MMFSTRLRFVFAIFPFLVQLAAAESERSMHDQLKIAAQKICPVSGKPLGSMGAPPKVRVGEEELFLCCQGCTKGKIDKQHWATIHKNFAMVQGKCPVMEQELPANAKWTIVKGSIVYVCCPPCTKKIQASPDEFLAKVDSYYATFLKAASSPPSNTRTQAADVRNDRSSAAAKPLGDQSRDGLRVAVQKICPVSGKALGSVGVPIKVRAGDIELYLCCEGCKDGEVSKEHWATIRGNIAAAQGICPVMEHELPGNALSTVVDGQIVFVCCPPCTKQIEAEPAKFLSRVDSYYQASLQQRTHAPAVLR